MRKLFTLLLAVATSVGTMFAWDYEHVQIDDLYYNLDAINQTAEVTYQLSWSENNYSGLTTAIIPASVTYNSVTYSVTSIGNYAFAYCRGLTSVTIGNSVANIGSEAFSDCTSLTSVTIPNSVTSIGNNAFRECRGLTSVTIGNSVTSIGERAFENCTGLTSVTIPNSVTSIENYAFQNCTGLTSVTIPNSVTSIGGSAFSLVANIVYNGAATGSPWGARSINGYVDGYLVYSDETKTNLLACSSAATGDIDIPNSVTSIGNNAFEGCKSLTSVTIPNSVTSIGKSAFYYCTGLTSVTIGNSVTSIRERAFYYCTGLTSVTIPNSVTSIGNYAFSNVANIIYSGSATGSPWGARSVNGYVDGYLVYSDETKTNLLACSSAATGDIEIPNSVTSIGDAAFEGCRGLTSVTIANSVTSIGDAAFEGCRGLTSVTIPNSVTSIGERAFYNCHSLTSITIPNSVTSIGNYAFRECSGLTSVTIGNSVTSIGDYAFYWCSSLTSVTIPNSVTSIGNLAFAYCTGLTSVTIPNSVTSIGNSAFYYCTGLTSVIIPNSVTSIGQSAFFYCTGLTSVTIPNSVTSIGNYAFSNVANIIYSGSATGSPWGARSVNGYVDGYLVYSDETKTNLLACSSAATGDIDIPNSVTSIGSYAFAICTGLTSVTIPNSVTSIGDRAFYGCSGLTSVYNFSPAPQVLESNVFIGVDISNCILYVPQESINFYKVALVWRDFKNILPVESSDQGIDQVPSDQVQSTKVIREGQIFILRGDKTYTLQGQEVK